jgi:hypothetical protein
MKTVLYITITLTAVCTFDSKEEFKLQFFEDRILRKISGLEKDERVLQADDVKRNFLVYMINTYSINREVVINIATSCRLDGQGFEPQERREIISFLKESRSDLARTKPPIQLGALHLVQMFRKSGAIPLLPLYDNLTCRRTDYTYLQYLWVVNSRDSFDYVWSVWKRYIRRVNEILVRNNYLEDRDGRIIFRCRKCG